MIDEKMIAFRARRMARERGIPFESALSMAMKEAKREEQEARAYKRKQGKKLSLAEMKAIAKARYGLRSANDLLNEARKYRSIKTVVSGGAFELGKRR